MTATRSRRETLVFKHPFRIASVELTRRLRTVNPEVRVMYDPRIARMKLDGANVPRARQRDRHDERAEKIAAVGAHGVRLRHRYDEVGRAEPPPAIPVRHRRQIGCISFGETTRNPSLDFVELSRRQPAVVLELARH